MCDPVTATGLALSAGGTFLQSREANNNVKRGNQARQDAYEAHQIRQRQYQDEAGAAFNTNIQNQGADSFQDAKANEADRIKQAFTNIRSTPDHIVGIPTSAPKNVVLSREREGAEVDAETDRNVNAFANLNGYRGAQFNNGLSQNAFGRAFGNIQDAAGRDSSLLGADINQAYNNSQRSPSAFPSLLKSGGQALSLYGSAGNGDFSSIFRGS